MQAHSYYRGMSNVPAPREVIEMYLMKEFCWTPKQIGEISYKKIQQIFLMINQENSVQRINNSRRELEKQTKNAATGRGNKFYREV